LSKYVEAKNPSNSGEAYARPHPQPHPFGPRFGHVHSHPLNRSHSYSYGSGARAQPHKTNNGFSDGGDVLGLVFPAPDPDKQSKVAERARTGQDIVQGR